MKTGQQQEARACDRKWREAPAKRGGIFAPSPASYNPSYRGRKHSCGGRICYSPSMPCWQFCSPSCRHHGLWQCPCLPPAKSPSSLPDLSWKWTKTHAEASRASSWATTFARQRAIPPTYDTVASCSPLIHHRLCLLRRCQSWQCYGPSCHHLIFCCLRHSHLSCYHLLSCRHHLFCCSNSPADAATNWCMPHCDLKLLFYLQQICRSL